MQSTTDDGASPTITSLFLGVAKNWRLFRACVILGFLLAVLMTVLKGKHYTTTFSIVPQAASTGQLRGLAAQFGFDVSGSQGAESPYFYLSLVQTDKLLIGVVNRHYAAGGTSGDYATFARIVTVDSARRTVEAVKAIRSHMGTTADRRTSIVTVRVTEEDPTLTLALAHAILDELAKYNRESRQSRAAAERRFVENRLTVARAELLAAEDSLQGFLTRNRQYQTSPELTFQHERLQRSVTQRSSVVSSLAQNFEQTRLDEVRDTPVFSMVEPPRFAAKPDPRGLRNAAITGAGVGFLVAVLLQVVLEVIGRLRLENRTEYQEWLATARDLRRNVLRR
jgi:uncharacterized protein involved in exopolysaccharide biosynthesis